MGWAGAGQDGALGCPQGAAKGDPGSCRGQEDWEDAHGYATWWRTGGDAGEAPQPLRNTALVQGLWDQLLESSNLLLSPGDFCTVFSELVFRAGQEVSCFQRNLLLHQAGMYGDSAIYQLGEPQRGRGTAVALARGCIASALLNANTKRNCWADPIRRG